MNEEKFGQWGSLAVTSHRFISHHQEFAISKISKAIAHIDNAWTGTIVVAVIGVAMLISGGMFVKLLGALVCFGAYKFHTSMRTAELFVFSTDGEKLYECEFKGGGSLATSVAEAINKAVMNDSIRAQEYRHSEEDKRAEKLMHEVNNSRGTPKR